MRRRTPLLLLFLLLTGCPGTAVTATYTPITGIVVDASSLVGGIGCGTAADEVYRYAAVLTYANDAGVSNDSTPVASGVFDCFADGVFSNLPASQTGDLDFAISVYAWNQASFPGDLQCSLNPSTPCPGDDGNHVNADRATATWTTTCTGIQQSGTPVLAVCGPLQRAHVSDAGSGVDAQPSGGSIFVDTHGFVTGDDGGGALQCGTGFDSAQASWQSGSQSGQTAAVACPAPLTLGSTTAGAAYSLTVQLSKAGAAVGQAACTATAPASGQAQAQCGAVGAP
jgi:hypothetical protein